MVQHRGFRFTVVNKTQRSLPLLIWNSPVPFPAVSCYWYIHYREPVLSYQLPLTGPCCQPQLTMNQFTIMIVDGPWQQLGNNVIWKSMVIRWTLGWRGVLGDSVCWSTACHRPGFRTHTRSSARWPARNFPEDILSRRWSEICRYNKHGYSHHHSKHGVDYHVDRRYVRITGTSTSNYTAALNKVAASVYWVIIILNKSMQSYSYWGSCLIVIVFHSTWNMHQCKNVIILYACGRFMMQNLMWLNQLVKHLNRWVNACK